MILMFLAGAGVLDDIMDGLHMAPGSYNYLNWFKSVEFKGVKNSLKD